MVSNKMIAIAVSIQSLFIVAFACYPDESIVTADLLLVFVMSVATIGYHKKRIAYCILKSAQTLQVYRYNVLHPAVSRISH